MNYSLILSHIVYQRTGTWPADTDPRSAVFALSGDGDSVSLCRWTVDDNPPDIAAFTPADEVAAQAALDQLFQDSKSPILKVVEGMYENFLSTEWTLVLIAKGLLAEGQIITAHNTEALQNMTYLMQLRAVDTEANKPTYSYFKNEFESFRNNIERLGGDMSRLP